MKNSVLGLIVLLAVLATGCSQNTTPATQEQTATQAKTALSADEALKLMQTDPNLVVLDVRTPQEFAQGHVENARNIDFLAEDFQQQISQLDPNGTYLLYCASGNRSGKATRVLQEKNFGQIFNSAAGFKDLKAAGAPTK